jgi:hypothetical protein
MKNFFKKVGKVIEDALLGVVAIMVAVSLLATPVAIFMLLLGWVLKVFGVM